MTGHAPPPTARLEAVIFDMDGVLVDSGPAHFESWRVLARERGLEVSDEQLAGQFGRASRDIIRALFGADLPDDEVARLDARKEAIFRDLIRGRCPAMPGALSLVKRLRRAGVPLGLGTSGPPENIDLVLDELGLRDDFAAVVSGMDVRHGKPEPDVFLLVASRLGVLPGGCVVIEDAPAGIEAAQRAGMGVVALASTHPPESLGPADLVVTSLDEVTVERLEGIVRARARGRG